MNHLAVTFSGYSVAGKFVPTRGDRLRIIGWGRDQLQEWFASMRIGSAAST
jgi:hypothetical protein